MPRRQPEPTEDARRAYVAWCVMPLNERNPKTHAELAEQLGVTLDTLRRLRRDPGFVQALGDAVLEALRDQLPDLTGRYIQAVGAAEGEKLRGLLEQMGVLRPVQDDKPKIIIGVDPDRL